MRAAFHNFKIAVTGRNAVSLPTFLLLVPFGLMVALEREKQFNPEIPLSKSLLITVAGFFASFLYLFIVQATLLKNRKKAPQQLWKCLFAWYSTGIMQGLASACYAHYAFGLLWELPERTLMTPFYIGTGLALVAFYFGSIDRRRVEDQALQSLEHMLAVDKGEMVTSDAKARLNAQSVLENLLKPQIEKLQMLIGNLNSSDGAHVSELTSASKELLAATQVEADSVLRSRELESGSKKVKLKRISLLSGIFPHELSVRVSVLLIAFGAFTGQFPRNGWEGVLAGEIGALIIGLVLFLLSRVVKRSEARNRRTFLLSSYFLVFLTQAIWTHLQSTIGFNLAHPYNPFYSATKTLYGVYVGSIISSLVVDTSKRLSVARDQSDVVRQEIAYLTREQEALDQHIYTTRFGSIQGKISGVIMALQLIEASGQTSEFYSKRKELMRNAHNLLNDALREIEALGGANAN